MAKKGQIFKKYDDNFRNKVVNDYFNNEGGVKRWLKSIIFLIVLFKIG